MPENRTTKTGFRFRLGGTANRHVCRLVQAFIQYFEKTDFRRVWRIVEGGRWIVDEIDVEANLHCEQIQRVSDYLSASQGAESLRYAMLYILPVVGFWSICHFYWASKTLREDLVAAPD